MQQSECGPLRLGGNRLARIVDRTRVLEDRGDRQVVAAAIQAELEVLSLRMGLGYIAVGLAVVCALLIGLLIVLAFADAFLAVNLSKVIGLLFVAAMLAFIASLLAFLREIFLAVASAREALRLKLPLQRILSNVADQNPAMRSTEEHAEVKRS